VGKSLYYDLERRTKEADDWWHSLPEITRIAIWEDVGDLNSFLMKIYQTCGVMRLSMTALKLGRRIN